MASGAYPSETQHVASPDAPSPVRRNPAPMIAWCEKELQHPWKAVLEPDLTQVFWFEHSDDAQRFALRFFPFKCS